MVTVWGYLTVSSKNAATGSLTIAGLPFVSRDEFGFYAGGIISYAYNSPTAGPPIRIPHNSTSIEIIEKSHTDINNDADIRFSLTYEASGNFHLVIGISISPEYVVNEQAAFSWQTALVTICITVNIAISEIGKN